MEGLAMEGLIPFVFGMIKKRKKRRPGRYYERLHYSPSDAALGRETFAGGAGAYHSQSCRFPVRTPADEELEFSYYDGGRRRASPEGLSGELSSKERGLSRSLRFSSMRVLACVSGA